MTGEAGRLLTALAERGIAARLMGGAAIRLLTAPSPFEREIADLDLIVARRDARALEDLMAQLGYEGDRVFNALNGNRRLLFGGPARVDVFVDTFEMCHALPLAERLSRRASRRICSRRLGSSWHMWRAKWASATSPYSETSAPTCASARTCAYCSRMRVGS